MSLLMKLPPWLRATGFVAVLSGLAGALGGVGVAGAFLVGRLVLASAGPALSAGDVAWILVLAMRTGMIAGLVLGPVLAWTLLRRAPLWRAVGETALAAAVGAALGAYAPVAIASSFVLAPVLAAVAALRLRYEFRPSRTLIAAPRTAI